MDLQFIIVNWEYKEYTCWDESSHKREILENGRKNANCIFRLHQKTGSTGTSCWLEQANWSDTPDWSPKQELALLIAKQIRKLRTDRRTVLYKILKIRAFNRQLDHVYNLNSNLV